MNVIILGYQKYDFVSNDRRIVGAKIHYVDGIVFDEKMVGMIPISCNIRSELTSKMNELPGLYEVDFKFRPGQQGPSVYIEDLKFVGKVNVEVDKSV